MKTFLEFIEKSPKLGDTITWAAGERRLSGKVIRGMDGQKLVVKHPTAYGQEIPISSLRGIKIS
jgi:hypothetical protein